MDTRTTRAITKDPNRYTRGPKDIRPQLQDYHQFHESPLTVDGVILDKDRLLFPPFLHLEGLSALHAAHQGVTAKNAKAETSVFWPGIKIK